MGIDERPLRGVPDAGVLDMLPNGIRIIRRKKHEPIEMGQLTRNERMRRTDKLEGSKFLPGTSLARIVRMTREVLLENDAKIGSNDGCGKVYDRPIGISRGRPVRGLRVRRSNNGTLAHAYPEDEQRL